MRVLVTGGSGQLGSLFLERCARHADVEQITVLDKVPPCVPSAKIRFVEADIRDPGIGTHFAGQDAVVHLAFLIFSHGDPALFDAVNVGGSENVFTLAAEAGVKHLLYASSVAAYGAVPGHPVPITEETRRRRDPNLIYAANKYDVESFLDAFEVAHPDIVVTRLRPAILVGRRMEHFVGRLLRRRLLLDFSGPPLPLVWDEDVADAFLLALERRAHGAFNLGSTHPEPSAQLAQATGLRLIGLPGAAVSALIPPLSLLKKLGFSAPIDPNWLRAGRHALLPSSEKARTELGWRPRHRTSREVIEQFVELASRRPNPRVAFFMRLTGLVERVAPIGSPDWPRSMRIHLDLVGSDGADYTIEVNSGRLRVSAGVPRPNDAVVRVGSQDFLQLLNGDLDWSTADLTGKVRLLGEADAKRVLGSLIDGFRRRQRSGGARAFAARKLSGWLKSGSRA